MQNVTISNTSHRKVKYKNGTKFNLGLAPIGLSDTRPREVSLIHVQLTY